MEKVVLITGSESLLGRKLVEKSLSRGLKVAAPVASNAGNSADSGREDLMVVPWNRSSVFSAKTVVREVERQFGKIDQALFLSPHSTELSYLMELSVSDLDQHFDNTIRGPVYLVKEMLSSMQKKKGGQLCFAMTGVKSMQSLQRGSSGFFRSFADSLIQESDAGLQMCGFLSDSTDMESYADFILEILKEELPAKALGQWLKHSERKNLFSSLPIEKRN